MPITYKLVGFTIVSIYDSYIGPISLSNINKTFESFGLTEHELNQVKFIIDSEHMTDIDKMYIIDENITFVYVYIFIDEIKEKLEKIFITHGKKEEDNITEKSKNYENEFMLDDDEELNESLVEEIENDEELNGSIAEEEIEPPSLLTKEIIEKINENTLLLLSDPDFIILLKIYKNKPHLFNLLSNYIQNNEISPQIIEDTIVYSEQEYIELSLKIMELGLGFSQEIIIETLIKYSGHLNLTIRDLLSN
jgi:hypothetical protein